MRLNWWRVSRNKGPTVEVPVARMTSGASGNAAQQRDEIASYQLIEVHFGPLARSRPDCRISNWRRAVRR